MQQDGTTSGFAIDGLRVFPDSGEIHIDGEVRRVEPRVMDVLVLLAGRAGEVVSRDELIEHVWRGALISDDVISRCIYQLRKELGENGRGLIKTVPKRGYSLTGKVTTIADSVPESSDSLPADDGASPRWQRFAIAAIAVLGIAAAWYAFDASREAPTPGIRTTVAVMPFAGESDTGADVLGPGIAEELLHRLSRHPALTVLARSSSFRDPDALKAAMADRQLVFLEGRISEQDDLWVLDVRLVDAATGGELWSTRLATDELAITDIQQQIEYGIVQALNAMPEGLVLPGSDFASDDLEAYRLLLQGRKALEGRDPESLQKAKLFFGQAAAHDPDYAAAYASLAEIGAHLSIYAGRRWANERERARDAIAKALTLKPDSAYVNAVNGLVNYADGNMGLAEPALLKAIELNPGYASAYAWLGLVYMAQGRTREAIDVHRMSATLSPLAATPQMNIGMAEQSLGDLDAAIPHFEKAIELDPTYGNAYWAAGYAYWRRGILSAAVEQFRSAADRNVVNPDFFAQYALLCFSAGCRDEANAFTEKATGIDRTGLWSTRATWAKYLADGDPGGLVDYFDRLVQSAVPGTLMELSLARAYALNGRWEEAAAIYETHYLTSDPWFYYHWDAEWGFSHGLMLALARQRLGRDYSDIVRKLHELVDNFGDLAGSSPGIAYLDACVAALEGDTSLALERLAEAHALGWRRWWWTDVDPSWSALRDTNAWNDAVTALKAAPEPEFGLPAGSARAP